MISKNRYRWLLLLPLVVATSLSTLTAQQRQHAAQLPDSLEFQITATSGVPEIPFQLVNNHIILPISVAGSEPFHLILDTGMPLTGLALFDSDKVQKLDLPITPGMKARVAGAGGKGKSYEAEMANGVAWSMPGLEATGSLVTILPAMPRMTHYSEGVIGVALFRHFTVEIDHQRNVIRLHDRDGYQAPPGITAVPLTFKMGIPYVSITARMADETPVPITLPVDIGASHAISLNSDSHEKITAPANSIETVLGRGLSGPIHGRVGRIATLDLGGFELSNVVASYPISEHQNPGGMDARNGNLGNDILKRFNVTFDYQQERMLLEPNERYDDPFEFDMSGIVFQQDDERGVYIESILPDSPARDAGLRPNDVILTVNGADAAAVGYFAIREQLRKDGEKVTIRYRRGKKEREVNIKLRRLV